MIHNDSLKRLRKKEVGRIKYARDNMKNSNPKFDVWGVYSRLGGIKTVVNKFIKSMDKGISIPADGILTAYERNLPLESKVIMPASRMPLNNVSFAVYGVLHGNASILRYCWAHSYNYYFIDHAYFDHDNTNYKITKNSMQATKFIERPDDRWKKLGIDIKPWNKNGDYILLIPPTGHMKRFYNLDNWVTKKTAEIKQYTDREIIIRRKPKAGVDGLSLEEHLSNAHAVVAFHSNVTTEAIIHGIPVFCDKVCAARLVGLNNLSKIETPIYPEREPWLHHLAYSQFSMEEISDGTAWDIVKNT